LGSIPSPPHTSPTDVAGLANSTTAIAVGGVHTCALSVNGAVQCWGWNGAGQLGDATNTDSYTPVGVFGLSNGVTAIASGWYHSCAVIAGGGLRCWGENAHGQLGDGSTFWHTIPFDVTGIDSGIKAVTAGLRHTCALTTAGAVKCWGMNDIGQLGDGSLTERHAPVSVNGLSAGVVAIAAGDYHTCAVTRGGGIKCWGYNIEAQLGNGVDGRRPAPGPYVLGLGLVSVLNVDDSPGVDALTDGLIILRYLFGLTGSAAVSGATAADALRTRPEMIIGHLDAVRAQFDVDGNGQIDALTDGLLMLRYLFGLGGAALVREAVGANATRADAFAIEAYLAALLP